MARLTRAGPDGDVATNPPASTAWRQDARPYPPAAGPSGCPTIPTVGTGRRTRSTGSAAEAARQQFQRLMRDVGADIAEALSNAGWLTLLDEPLHGIRHRRGLPVLDYAKTHHRCMLVPEHWPRAAGAAGRRAVRPYPRVGDPSGRGRASPASRCRRASAAMRRSRRPTARLPGCRASRRPAPVRAGAAEPDADRGPPTASGTSPRGEPTPRAARRA